MGGSYYWASASVACYYYLTRCASCRWYYGRPSARSAPLVAKVYRELGHELLYWADTYADDLPYWTEMPGGKPDEGLIMAPYTLYVWSPATLGSPRAPSSS